MLAKRTVAGVPYGRSCRRNVESGSKDALATRRSYSASARTLAINNSANHCSDGYQSDIPLQKRN